MKPKKDNDYLAKNQNKNGNKYHKRRMERKFY